MPNAANITSQSHHDFEAQVCSSVNVATEPTDKFYLINQTLVMQQEAAYNPFDIRVFQFADYLKYFLSFTNRNSMISAAAEIMQITPTQQTTAIEINNLCRI